MLFDGMELNSLLTYRYHTTDVSVENGILSVGGVPVFSLQDGEIARN